MYEEREWIELNVRVHDLQEKVNAYVTYVLGGQLVETVEYRGRPVAIELFVRYQPPASMTQTFEKVKLHLDGERIKFRVYLGQTRAYCVFQ